MKVKHLIAELKKYDSELEVLMSVNAEGNDFSRLYEVAEGFWDSYDRQMLHEDDINDVSEVEKVMVLWPDN